MTSMTECNIHGEDARIAALHRYEVLDTEPEEAFDRITRLAKTVLQMPMVVVSLVDRDRQWFKSRQGVGATQTPRDISFCTHTIQDTRPLVVTDAHVDPRFAASPLVLGEPYIRFYIGVPLRSRDGHNVGALCSMDTKVRHLSGEQINVLVDLGRLVVDELELRVQASTDSLTGAMSRRSFLEQAHRDVERSKRYGTPLSCALIDLDHFKSINDAHGHGIGDLVLQRVASICKSELRACDYLGRLGGEEFAVMLPETSLARSFEVAERLRRALEKTTIEASGQTVSVTASIGVAEVGGTEHNTDRLLRNADIAMYEAKADGRNRVACYLGDDAMLFREGSRFPHDRQGRACLHLRTEREAKLVRALFQQQPRQPE
jgi:diguanylate cyclase (GGDEF)-like protein